MKILLFGGSGLLGSAIREEAGLLGHEVVAPAHEDCPIANRVMVSLFTHQRYDVVINVAGKIKPISNDDCIINAVGPGILAAAASYSHTPFVHISTDCVFSGKPGSHWHHVDDIPDPVDIYGASKRLGELTVLEANPRAAVVRTSFIGSKHGLLRWFLDQPQNAVVHGYAQAMWSGSTANEVARKLLHVAPVLHGIQHLAIPEPISKYDLLRQLQVHLRPDLIIGRVDEPIILRGLIPTIYMDDIQTTISDLLAAVR